MSIRKLANLAGISPAAVSLALRDSAKISLATRQRVHALAAEIGYRPNAKVRQLMGQISLSKRPESQACFGVISLYESPKPWEQSLHLKRMFDGMVARAAALGYRLEPLWIREPGMTYVRFRRILEARGIDGVLCFGSPDFDEPFPIELPGIAVVTQGLSIASSLHRVISHAYNDTWNALDRAHDQGCRRPGLVLGQYEEVRSGHANASAFLGWCEHRIGISDIVPLLRMEEVDEDAMRAWLERYDPDVLIFAHHYSVLGKLAATLRRIWRTQSDRRPVIVLSQVVAGSGFAGMEENQPLIGEWAVELLVARIVNRDFGVPVLPRIEMVESRWVDGESFPVKP